jgi:hypothetical protein
MKGFKVLPETMGRLAQVAVSKGLRHDELGQFVMDFRLPNPSQ